MSHPDTYVTSYAEREGLATVALSNFELARILSGHAMICATLDGQTRICVRLASTDELIAFTNQARAAAGLALDGPGSLTRAMAEQLSRPLPDGAL